MRLAIVGLRGKINHLFAKRSLKKYKLVKIRIERMEITAEMVKGLRQQSGAGIMECKNALKETSGDIEEAVTFLRKKRTCQSG